MAAVKLPGMPVTDWRYLSLPDDLPIFYLRQAKSDTGAALSFYYPQGDQDHDDPGECICPAVCHFVFL